ncbi:MAG: OmpW family outer membrane protein, partial [Gemmatimonadota bacterium]
MGSSIARYTVVLGALLLAAAGPLAAQDSETNPWQLRLRGLAAVPDEEATISVIGGDVEVDDAYVPELDISYFLSDQVALELVLATAEHNAVAVQTSLGAVDLGSVWLLPPTLVLQYHFLPAGAFQPYLGAGINYTIFYNTELPA